MTHRARKGLKFGDPVMVKRTTHDGTIWVASKVEWLGQMTFRILLGTKVISLAYSAEEETWRRVL